MDSNGGTTHFNYKSIWMTIESLSFTMTVLCYAAVLVFGVFNCY